jgi:hypothetical protein
MVEKFADCRLSTARYSRSFDNPQSTMVTLNPNLDKHCEFPEQ